ncbi:MAG: hypothetical protein A3I24_00580 [Candidatus Harrisonbacteria bacterium RIFCSPLOWO2_02_FULL_41_13b]|uniref:Peptidase M16 n=1 Tax=Candidatus Harrisonbacteria bacterium RIFCSPLOWO2_02_FULL_41_13b TaxID=1798409 RepID=A0A1G1ZR36_9BACT|nr:MAG: hypothetical protein A3I24_00580 [Candidatus Harrisonbacteria bacterium RIFCSPLOWO2_02_FULL_41_13b]
MNFSKKTLKNGLRVITIPKPDSLATTVLVLVEAGSKYETKEINGLSHFLEHMCFKGTTKRPTALDIAGELDGLGAEYNAFTSQEWTGYYAKVQNEHKDKALDVISDLYLNPVFNLVEIEKEKGVVIEELNMYEDTPQRKVQDLFSECLYGDQPAGWDVGGKKEIIQKLNREDFLKYRGEHYVAKATIIVAAGAVDEKWLLPQIEKHFVGISNAPKFGKLKTQEAQEKPALLVKFKESDQTHLVLGVRAFDAFDERRYAGEVLADILGGGMSSRLFQRVREELGAAYYVNASLDLYSDHGYFAVSAGVDHKKLEIVIKAILDELMKIASNSLTDKELHRAKDHLSGRMTLGLETSDALALFYGGQEVLKREVATPEEVLKKIHFVTKENIVGLAKEIFKNSSLNMSLIGPYKDKAPLEKTLKF